MDLSRVSVLIADPNPFMRTIIRGVINSFGISAVREAADGADALREINITPVDIVFTEYAMSPLDGIELTKLLRAEHHSKDRFVSVIMVTSYSEKHHVEEARDVGVTEFLAKPVSAKGLWSRLSAVIYRQRDFIDAPHYFGPDRRRKWTNDFRGDDRRAQEDFETTKTVLSKREPGQARVINRSA